MKQFTHLLEEKGFGFVDESDKLIHLLDIFNSTGEEAKDITANSFEELDIGNLLSMNRQNGFYQMIGMMQERT